MRVYRFKNGFKIFLASWRLEQSGRDMNVKKVNMRIPPEEQAAIVSTITSFDKASEIWLFGSRLDDTKRGGDIDVLVKSDVICRSMLARIEDELFRKIDEQKIDFVLTRKNELNSFSRMVLARGAVQLW